jgi:hypothetical protein
MCAVMDISSLNCKDNGRCLTLSAPQAGLKFALAVLG